jgi:cation-dependent mannose-6-phosphate receptor
LETRRESEDDQEPAKGDKDKETGKDKEKDKEKDKDKDKAKESDGHGRKSTLLYFSCDKEAPAGSAKFSFLGTDPDECGYSFEVRSQAACGGAEPVQSGLGPGGVFGVILLIAVVVYFVGGIMYQRTVAHARGWRQLPNYSLWAGIGSFIQVSLRGLIAGAKYAKGPKVTSVRDGILPTMEHRPIARALHRSYGSRSHAAYPP